MNGLIGGVSSIYFSHFGAGEVSVAVKSMTMIILNLSSAQPWEVPYTCKVPTDLPSLRDLFLHLVSKHLFYCHVGEDYG